MRNKMAPNGAMVVLYIKMKSNRKENRLFGRGGRIRTYDLWVMSPTSYQTAPPRIESKSIIYNVFFQVKCLSLIRYSLNTGINQISNKGKFLSPKVEAH